MMKMCIELKNEGKWKSCWLKSCSVQGGCSHLYLNDILTFPKTTLQDYWSPWRSPIEWNWVNVVWKYWQAYCDTCVHGTIRFEGECLCCCLLHFEYLCVFVGHFFPCEGMNAEMIGEVDRFQNWVKRSC